MLLSLYASLALGAAAPPVDAGPGAVPARPIATRAMQEAVLARFAFLVGRDACVLVEYDAPSVRAFDFDKTGTIAAGRMPLSRCDPAVSPSALARAMAGALILAARAEAPTATLPAFDVAQLDDAVLALTGRRLVASRTAVKDPDPAVTTAQSYDAVSLRGLFDALYAKPTELRLGVPLQTLYDATMKRAVAGIAADIAALCARPKVLVAEARRAMDAARSGKGPAGKDAWRVALNRLVASDEDAARIDPRLVGFVLRREADGTLPVVRDALRTVLADYDPKTAAALNGRL